jgi:uncharacterized RDD family membrane protein YckC
MVTRQDDGSAGPVDAHNRRSRFRPSWSAVPVRVAGRDVVCASFGRRAASHVVDVALLSVVQGFVLVVAVAPAFSTLLPRLDAASRLDDAGERVAALVEAVTDAVTAQRTELVVALVVAWLIGGVYEVLMTRFRGGTIGKIVTACEVVDSSTLGPLSWRACLARWGGPAAVSGVSVMLMVAQVVTVVGYGWAAFDPNRRAAHDLVSGALVIERAQPRHHTNNDAGESVTPRRHLDVDATPGTFSS